MELCVCVLRIGRVIGVFSIALQWNKITDIGKIDPLAQKILLYLKGSKDQLTKTRASKYEIYLIPFIVIL